MEKMGHVKGHGLGKNENGITEPVKVDPRQLYPSLQSSFVKEGGRKKEKQTVLIAGTSMIGGLNQKTMSKRFKVKVRSHPGATIPELKHHLAAHFLKKPDYLLLQVGTNDAVDPNLSSDDVYDRIMDLKSYAETTAPGIQVTVSCPLVRTDDLRANSKLVQVKNRLIRSSKDGLVSIITNDNIKEEHLSNKGLHLSQPGTRQLALNMISFMKNIKD